MFSLIRTSVEEGVSVPLRGNGAKDFHNLISPNGGVTPSMFPSPCGVMERKLA